jgi:hypothetical protein
MDVAPTKKEIYDNVFRKRAIDAFLEKVAFYSHDNPAGRLRHKDGPKSQAWL